MCPSLCSSNKDLASSLERCVDGQDPEVNQVLRMLTTYAMQNALYFSTGSCRESDFYHYGNMTSITMVT